MLTEFLHRISSKKYKVDLQNQNKYYRMERKIFLLNILRKKHFMLNYSPEKLL